MSMDEHSSPEEPQPEGESSQAKIVSQWRRRWKLGVVLIAVGLLAILAAVAGLAVYQGLQDRAAIAREKAEAHYQAGLDHLEAGELDLAIAEFDLALRLAPDHDSARAKLAEARQTLTVVKTPTSEVFSGVLDGLFEQAVALYDAKEWDDAAAAFAYIMSLDADYRWEEIEQYRFDCYRLKGEALEAENRLEEAIRAYDQALRVNPAAQEIAERREMLALYVAGSGAAGADWEKAIAAFRRLYGIDPTYRDVEHRLYEAYVGHGDAFMAWGLWCQAQTAYTTARDMDDNPTVQGKLNDAAQRCDALASATAVPQPTTATREPPVITQLPSGKLFLAQYDDDRKTYDIVAVSAGQNAREVVARNAAQPAISPDGKRLAFQSTDKTAPGIFILDIDAGTRIAVTTSARDSRPFWSPDGTEIAFIRDATSPTAAILSAPTDGTGQAEILANGWSAAWSGTNHLAFTGCDESRMECGIYVADLSRGGQIKITADQNDIGLAWSRDSTHVAFMSNHDGNWEIYTVRLEGGYVRRCTVNFADDGSPAWSPDGQYIAFVSNRDGIWALYVMLADGSEQRQVMELSMSNPGWVYGQMAWSP